MYPHRPLGTLQKFPRIHRIQRFCRTFIIFSHGMVGCVDFQIVIGVPRKGRRFFRSGYGCPKRFLSGRMIIDTKIESSTRASKATTTHGSAFAMSSWVLLRLMHTNATSSSLLTACE